MSSGELQSLHISANYWLATMKNSGKAYQVHIAGVVTGEGHSAAYMSIRCIKD